MSVNKMFDFSKLEVKSVEWYLLQMEKMKYIAKRHYEDNLTPTDIAREIGSSTANVRNVLGSHRKLIKAYSPMKNAETRKFYNTYCGELYDILAKNGIDTFKKLELIIKKCSLEQLNGVGYSRARIILAIFEKYLLENKKKAAKTAVKAESKKSDDKAVKKSAGKTIENGTSKTAEKKTVAKKKSMNGDK